MDQHSEMDCTGAGCYWDDQDQWCSDHVIQHRESATIPDHCAQYGSDPDGCVAAGCHWFHTGPLGVTACVQ
jgi:hypothetical protein